MYFEQHFHLDGKSAWNCCRSPAGALAAIGFVGPSRQRAGEPPILLDRAKGDSSSHWAGGSRRPWSKQNSCLQELRTTQRCSPAAMQPCSPACPKITHPQGQERLQPQLLTMTRPVGLKPSCFGQEFPFRRENLDVDSKIRTIHSLVPQVISWEAPLGFKPSFLWMFKLCCYQFY